MPINRPCRVFAILLTGIICIVSVDVTSVANALPLSTSAAASVGGNNYPWGNAAACGYYDWCLNGKDLSPLGFGYRNCTDYAAYELNEQMGGTASKPKFSFSAFGFTTADGNAAGWKKAITIKLGAAAANGTPAVGSVAWWDSSEPNGGFGHVAIVASISRGTDGSVRSIVVDDYNSDHNDEGDGLYASYSIDKGSSDWPDSFLHIADASSSPPLTPATPAVVQRPSGETDVTAVVGGQLQFFWNFPGQNSWASEPIASGTVTGSPAVVQRPSGETDVTAVVGGQLQFFWNFPGQNSWASELV